MTISRARRHHLLFAVPLIYGLVAAAYFVLRPAGHWSENDTALVAEGIAGVVRAQRLLPPDGTAYPNGYAYQTVAAFILGFTGLEVSTFQQLLSPFLMACIMLPVAWIAYRELTGGAAGATLASLLLLLQPELLFVTLRGSHEKITRTLMLLALLMLVRSLRLSQQPRQFAIHVVLFYAAAYGVVASNNMFGTSFIAVIAMALLGNWILSRGWPRRLRPLAPRLTRRLLYNTVVLLGIAFVFTFYAYPPATNQLDVYQEIWKRVTVLLLNVGQEEPVGDPYSLVVAGWISLPVYFLVSVSNWLLMAISLIFWLRDGWTWFVRRVAPPPSAWLLWLLYAAITVQGVLAVVVDFSGAVASNFQHRAFASFAIIAVAVVARGAVPLLSTRLGRTALARGSLAAVVGCLAVLSVLKASNEPLLSNKWTFYEPQEIQALQWASAHMRQATIATEFDERLNTAYMVEVGASVPPGLRPVGAVGGPWLGYYRREFGGRDYLVTDITRWRAQRLGASLPPVGGQIATYDNGMAQIYHLVPLTPYQR